MPSKLKHSTVMSSVSDLDLQSISNMRISPRDNPFTIWSREHGRETCSSLARLEENFSRSGLLPTDGASFLHAGSFSSSLGFSRGSLGASRGSLASLSQVSLGAAGDSCVSLGATGLRFFPDHSGHLPDTSSAQDLPATLSRQNFTPQTLSLSGNKQTNSQSESDAGHTLSSLSLLGSSGYLDDYIGFGEQSVDVVPAGQVNSIWSRRTPSNRNVPLINKAPVNPRPNYKRSSKWAATMMTQADAPPAKRVNSPGVKRVLVMWTPEEDQRLEEGVAKYGLPNWIQIAQHVKTRNNKMCAQRWRNCLRSEIKAVKKGKWAKDEDQKLRDLVSKYDEKNGATWERVSESMNFTRNSKQCRERWVNFLDPNLRLGPWTVEEDTHLLRLHDQMGKCWKKFTSVLKGRSAERIRRRFTSLNKLIKQSRM